MPSPFVVTVVPTSLSLTPGSQNGSLDVTVSNKSGRALTARAVRVVNPRTAADWLQPRDREEFPMAIGETKKLTYGVNVPGTTTPQTVTGRMDFVDVSNPDEFFTQGTGWSITVIEAVKPIEKPWWKKALPYAVAAVLVIAVGVGIYAIVPHDKNVHVPVVVGQLWDTAGARLTRAGFKVAELQPTDVVVTSASGQDQQVKSINPPDSVLKKGTTVSLKVYRFLPTPPPPPPGGHGGVVVGPAIATPLWITEMNNRATTTWKRTERTRAVKDS